MKSFYQINPRQVEVLYRSAIRMAHLSKEDIALDAYCGIGTISLSVADQVKKVYGIEVVPDAIRDARVNAANNQIDNAVFINGDAGKEALKLKSEHISFDVVFVDPPRKGCSELFLRQLVELTPERLIYISCNVATQARDMNILKDYYDILEIQPVDMFPETKSIENIVSMRRKKD